MSNPSAQRLIVFMVGGVTYSEMRTAYQVGKRNNAEVYLGSSHVFTPLSYMDSLRVIGTPRQPVPPDLHVEARRRAQEAEREQLLAQQQGKKVKNAPPLKKPQYPQDLWPQARYDLRFTTEDEVPSATAGTASASATPADTPAAPPPMPEKSANRLARLKKGGKDISTGASASSTAKYDSTPPNSDSPDPTNAAAGAVPAAPTSVAASDPPISTSKNRWGRDMSKFKVCFHPFATFFPIHPLLTLTS